MCGRYTLKTSAIELQREFNLDHEPQLEARYNIAPLQAAPIITDRVPRELTVARWGLLPHWAKDVRIASRMINARAETLTQKTAFKELLGHHRCLVVCDGFYEWKRHGQQRTPMYIHPVADRPMAMAGLWSTWTSPDGIAVVTFTIVTTRANELVRPIHDRMPVFLDVEARKRWLSGPTKDLPALIELLTPWRGEAFEAYQVSPHVNSALVDDAACIEAAKTVQLSLL